MELQTQYRPMPEQAQQTKAKPAKLPVNKIALKNKVKTSANWFYWIAALSVINTILWHSGTELTFIFGLAFTQLADGLVLGLTEASQSTILMFIGIGISVMIAGAFALFGYLARKRQKAGFIVGLIFYCFDAVIFLLFFDWLSLGFHAFAIWQIVGGYKALSKLKASTLTPAAPGQ